jgi:hypothetical protein
VTVENSSRITGNNGTDVYNLGVLYLDSTSTIGDAIHRLAGLFGVRSLGVVSSVG